MTNTYVGSIFAVDVVKREAKLGDLHNNTHTFKFSGKRTEIRLITAMRDNLIVCITSNSEYIGTLKQLVEIPLPGEEKNVDWASV